MKVVIGSMFRDSAGGQLARYSRQVFDLAKKLAPNELRVVAAEGDSTDKTKTAIGKFLSHPFVGLTQIDATHGGPKFGSTEQPERLEALTKVGNKIFEAIREDDDIFVYVESDLIWDPETIMSLIKLVELGTDVVAPLVFAGENFYDVFAFRKNGQRFAPFPPYHSELNPTELTEVDSVGSCLVMKGNIAREIRMPPGGVLIGWCDEARKAGYKINVAAQLRIKHP